jgi:hypothetical protein
MGCDPLVTKNMSSETPLIGVVHLSTLIELLDLFVRTKSTIIGVSFP